MDLENQTKRPTHVIYVVHGEDNNARWLKIGVAWPHKDNKGANMRFDAFPAPGGRIVVRENTGKDAITENGGQQ